MLSREGKGGNLSEGQSTGRSRGGEVKDEMKNRSKGDCPSGSSRGDEARSRRLTTGAESVLEALSAQAEAEEGSRGRDERRSGSDRPSASF